MKHNLSAKKHLGQNFLIDSHVLNKIIKSADVTPADFVIEIGAGIGGLTQALCENAGRVCAIEIDSDLLPVLKENLAAYDNADIVNADALTLDLHAIIKSGGYNSAKVVANLPFYITTPIITFLLENKFPLTSITIMLQREAAEKICAQCGAPGYGITSILVNYFADAYLVANVPQNCFLPRPTVDSVVLRLTPLGAPRFCVKNEQVFFNTVKLAFGQRRKTILNCIYNGLTAAGSQDLTKELLRQILDAVSISENARAEQLTPEQLGLLSNHLISYMENIMTN